MLQLSVGEKGSGNKRCTQKEEVEESSRRRLLLLSIFPPRLWSRVSLRDEDEEEFDSRGFDGRQQRCCNPLAHAERKMSGYRTGDIKNIYQLLLTYQHLYIFSQCNYSYFFISYCLVLWVAQ